MRRYKFATEKEIFEAWNKLRDALLVAHDGKEVNTIMQALFTDEEKFQLGRRILIAEYLRGGMTFVEISDLLKVGKETILRMSRKLEENPEGFSLIEKRGKKVEQEYQKKKYKEVGGSKLIRKQKKYTGIMRKDIGR